MLTRLIRLPTTATAPFCPSEVQGSILIDGGMPLLSRLKSFAGPGLLVAIGYMDPGNWATDIQAGSEFGDSLLWVVALASLAAIVLQLLAARLGLVTGRDLAVLCAQRSGPIGRLTQWLSAELSIIMCDVAEVLGCALAFKLLLGLSLAWGIALTGLDTILVLGLQGRGFRRIEAIVLGLVGTLSVCFVVELVMVQPQWGQVVQGLIPSRPDHDTQDAVAVALGIVGATVMPHNLYLHSSIVQTRRVTGGRDMLAATLAFSSLDTCVSLVFAMAVNAALLVLAGSAFHSASAPAAVDLDQAFHLLTPVAGPAAAFLFGLALLASGQSATLTGTIAGQVIMDGFIHLKIPCYQRRLITRMLALLPALFGILWLGDGAIGKLLLWSQVVLGLQLPLVMWPLIRMSGDRTLMGKFAIGGKSRAVAWLLFVIICAANLALLMDMFR